MRKESSANLENETILRDYCQAMKTLQLFSGRWKISILFAIYSSVKTYTELKSLLPNVSDRMLAKQLNELITDRLLEKEKTKTTSSYRLTSRGRNICKLLELLRTFEDEKS
ncbi:HTH-type transcriptional activator hxlR [Sphingobacterium spiritivorum]|uniref:HTH-type transcriptional activator hxlR n=1 Tax=Sphingobacterium spiritivorum TaxID=258 RepID=A0A380CT12_SPHSI|nr:helix-turn-helix domain-containing protein [Sphingobacterium spiritivorum]SUJ28521.1 HTH-type transcriptional activator hxlR [Sphingobacterium spiritivorum]